MYVAVKLGFTELEQVNNGDEVTVMNSIKPGPTLIGKGDCTNQDEVP